MINHQTLCDHCGEILQGKNKPTYSPNFLCGDKVIVTNAKCIRVTGNKYNDKIYDKYTGYPSGRKEMSLKVLMSKNPARVLQMAVRGMLPKNTLGKWMLKSLKIYPTSSHKHQAQKPETISV